MFVFLFRCKKRDCFHVVQGMGEGSEVVERMASGFGERLRPKLAARGVQRDPSEASGLQGCYWCLRVSLWKRLAQPTWGSRLRRGVRCRPSRDELVSPARPGRGSPGSHRAEGLLGQNPGHADPKGPGSGSSPRPCSFHGTPSFTPCMWGRLQGVLEENAATALVLHL